MEQNQIMEGLLPEEIQRLRDMHAAVFKGTIEEIHQNSEGKNRKPARASGNILKK